MEWILADFQRLLSHPGLYQKPNRFKEGEGVWWPVNEVEFEDALDKLIIEAHQNGVEIADGTHVLQHTDEEVPDVEVMFYRLAESPDRNK